MARNEAVVTKEEADANSPWTIKQKIAGSMQF